MEKMMEEYLKYEKYEIYGEDDISNQSSDVAITRVEEPSGPDLNERLTAEPDESKVGDHKRKRKRGKHVHKREELDSDEEINEEKRQRVTHEKELLPKEDFGYKLKLQTLGESNCTLLSLNNVMKRQLLTEEDLNEAGTRLQRGAESKGYNGEGFYKKATKRHPTGGDWSINCVASALRRKYGDQVRLETVNDPEQVLTIEGRYLVSVKSNSGTGHMIGIKTKENGRHSWYDPLIRFQSEAAGHYQAYLNGGYAKYWNTAKTKQVKVHFQGMYRAWKIIEKV